MPINLSSKNPKIARSCSVTTIECRTQSDSWDVQSWHEVALAGEGPRSCSGLLVDLTLQKKGYKVLQASKHCTHNTKVSIRSRSPQTKSCLNVLTLGREMSQNKSESPPMALATSRALVAARLTASHVNQGKPSCPKGHYPNLNVLTVANNDISQDTRQPQPRHESKSEQARHGLA